MLVSQGLCLRDGDTLDCQYSVQFFGIGYQTGEGEVFTLSQPVPRAALVLLLHAGGTVSAASWLGFWEVPPVGTLRLFPRPPVPETIGVPGQAVWVLVRNMARKNPCVPGLGPEQSEWWHSLMLVG